MNLQSSILFAVVFCTAFTCCAVAGAADPSCGTWEVVPTPMPAQADRAIIRDIVAISDNDVWAVGDWNGTVNGQYQTFALAMHWDGSSWTIVDIPQPAPCNVCHNLGFWAVDATGPNDVWAAGHQLKQAPDGFVGTHILVMHYDGSSWKVMDTPILGGGSGDIVWGMDAVAPDDVWFFGDAHPIPVAPQPALAMHWNGSAFNIVSVPQVNDQVSGFGNGNSLRAGFAISSNDIWAVGAAGDGDSLSCNLSQIHRWNGAQWVHVPSSPPDNCFWHDLEAVVAISEGEAWAGGDSFDGAYHGLALHWTGSSWSQVPTPIGIRDFVAFSSDNVWAVGGGIAHWDGSQWSLVETFPQVLGPTFAGASAPPNKPCSIWAGGRQLSPSHSLLPLVVRYAPLKPAVPGDLDGNGSVGVADLLLLLGQWGPCAPGTCGPGSSGGCAADLDGDCVVGVADLLALLGNWG